MLARTGRSSLHHRWIGSGERDWDLRLVPYQPIDADERCDYVVGDVITGPKWSGLRDVLNTWDGWRAYDYVWLPDDDILAGPKTIGRMFDAARRLGFDLFAPALDEKSYYAHFITMRNRRFFARSVGFVEIMVPGFSTAALDKLLDTLALTETGWGWGLDSLWPKLLNYENVGIIDGTPVMNTRPVGQMRDEALAARVLAESDAIMIDDDCAQRHVTFGGWTPDMTPLAVSPERLLAEVVEGSDYLIERDPRVLAWIVEFQRPDSGWPEYPVAGTPAVRSRFCPREAGRRPEPAKRAKQKDVMSSPETQTGE